MRKYVIQYRTETERKMAIITAPDVETALVQCGAISEMIPGAECNNSIEILYSEEVSSEDYTFYENLDVPKSHEIPN